jgi:glucose-6-phosphate isomerase
MTAVGARARLAERLGGEAALAGHFVAVPTNVAALAAFASCTANMFAFWEWVGSRSSLRSASGLPRATGRPTRFCSGASIRPRWAS